jgi:uncharacterized protein with PIN domain
MIKLSRTRTEAAIAPIFVGKQRIQLNKKLMEVQRDILKGSTDKHEWDSSIWGKSKTQLLKESSNKCAYCEAPLKAVAYGDVEHYRPKSVYWWLAYNYENYLASCTLCNQAFKKDHFSLLNQGAKLRGPAITKTTTKAKIDLLAAKINCDPLTEKEGMPFKDFLVSHKKEKALLVNPYYDEPDKIFGYTVDDALQEVEIYVLKTVMNASAIQTAIVDDYGLNRLELKQLRYEWYDNYVTFKITLKESNISSTLRKRIEKKIERFKKPISPFSGMILYFDK